MSAWQPCGRRLRECMDDVCRSMGECAWPPVRHADHDPGLICRPALGASVLCEVLGDEERSDEGDEGHA